jgi:ubiquitin C-terminal hydrolase
MPGNGHFTAQLEHFYDVFNIYNSSVGRRFRMNDGNQQDAHEFFGQLVEALNPEFSDNVVLETISHFHETEGQRPITEREPSGVPVRQPFLSLPIDHGSIHSVQDAVNRVFAPEEIKGVTHPVDGKRYTADRSARLLTPKHGVPDEMFFQIVRNGFDPNTGENRKLSKPIEAFSPVILQFSHPTTGAKTQYECTPTSFVVHRGDHKGGHYYTYTYLPGTGHYIKHDDEAITPLTKAENTADAEADIAKNAVMMGCMTHPK